MAWTDKDLPKVESESFCQARQQLYRYLDLTYRNNGIRISSLTFLFNADVFELYLPQGLHS